MTHTESRFKFQPRVNVVVSMNRFVPRGRRFKFNGVFVSFGIPNHLFDQILWRRGWIKSCGVG